MDPKGELAAREQAAADLYTRLPAVLKVRAKIALHQGDVYPWKAVAAENAWCKDAQIFSDLLLEISELKVELAMEKLEGKGPPDLTLAKIRKWRR